LREIVVVTGGAGFIGSHLTRELCGLGYDVVVLDNFLRGRKEYIDDLVKAEKVELVRGDIRDYDLVSDVMKNAVYLFHEAAVCINYSVAMPAESLDINVRGTYNVFKAAKEHKVKKVVFSSSASVYGNPDYLPMDEKHPLKPITPYCVGKIAGEYLLKMGDIRAMNHIIYRNFNVYGPRQAIDAYYTSVVVSFVKRILQSMPPKILGGGDQSMDFVSVHDVVKANIAAIKSDITGEVFNVGSGVSTSVNDLAKMVSEICGSDLEPEG
jgi:UDP-glucose 4-epimerase